MDTDLRTRGRRRKRLTNQLTSAHTQTSQRTTTAAFLLPYEWPAWTTVPATTETTFPLMPCFPNVSHAAQQIFLLKRSWLRNTIRSRSASTHLIADWRTSPGTSTFVHLEQSGNGGPDSATVKSAEQGLYSGRFDGYQRFLALYAFVVKLI